MTDEAVRDARDAVLEAYDDSMTSPNFEADREHDERFIAALDAFEAAIRASERAKVESLVTQLERSLGIIEHGAEMVGLDVYEFTKDEVIGEAASAIRAALDAVRAGSES